MIRSAAILLLSSTVACGGASTTTSRAEKPRPLEIAHLPKLDGQIIELGAGGAAPGPRHKGAPRHLLVSPDDRWLVSSGDDGLVLRWSLEKPSTPPLVLFDGKDEQAPAVALSPDARLVAVSLGEDRGAQVLSIDGGAPIFQAVDGATAIALAFDGTKKLWIASSSGSIALYDVVEQEALWRAPVAPGRDITDPTEYDALMGPSFVVFRPRAVRSNDPKGSSLAFALPGGRPTATLDLSLHCAALQKSEVLCPGSVRTKPDADPQSVLRFLDVRTGQVRLLKAPAAVDALSPSHDHSVIALATVSSERSVNMTTKPSLTIVDAVRGEERTTRNLPERAVAVAMTRSGHVLVSHASGAIRMLEP